LDVPRRRIGCGSERQLPHPNIDYGFFVLVAGAADDVAVDDVASLVVFGAAVATVAVVAVVSVDTAAVAVVSVDTAGAVAELVVSVEVTAVFSSCFG
jgi:hypothetical protein